MSIAAAPFILLAGPDTAMDPSTLLASLAGGLLIGGASLLLLICTRRVAGISGIVGGLLPPRGGDTGWRVAFLAGLLLAPAAFALIAVTSPPVFVADAPALVVAGLLVGIGTRFASGCTSGHGVCGLSCLSRRSLAATVTFMAAGIATVYVVRHVVGG